MSDRIQWEVEQLKESEKRKNKQLQDHERRIDILESFKDKTVEKLLQIFKAIEKLEKANDWLKRTFATSLITAVIGAVFSFVAWLVQRGW